MRSVEQRHRGAVEHLEATGHDELGGDRSHVRAIEITSEKRPGRAGGRGEVALLVAAAGAKLDVHLGARLEQRRAALLRRLVSQSQRVRIEVGAHDQRGPGAHDVKLFACDVGDRRAEVARVFETDVREHRDRGVDDVCGVVATAEARLEHGHIDSGRLELAQGRGGQQFELRDDVAGGRGGL